MRAAVHVALYRRFLGLFPVAHRRRHGADQLQLFADLIASGSSPGRLWVGSIPDLYGVLKATPRRAAVSHLARLGLYPLSLLGVAAGATLATVAATTGAVPAWVAGPALAVALQGGFTLLWLRDMVPLGRRISDQFFMVGETAAVLAGGVGTTLALVAQWGSADPEYGPMTVLLVVTAHGVAGLTAGSSRPPLPTPT